MKRKITARELGEAAIQKILMDLDETVIVPRVEEALMELEPEVDMTKSDFVRLAAVQFVMIWAKVSANHLKPVTNATIRTTPGDQTKMGQIATIADMGERVFGKLSNENDLSRSQIRTTAANILVETDPNIELERFQFVVSAITEYAARQVALSGRLITED